jgi:hypothetical protein
MSADLTIISELPASSSPVATTPPTVGPNETHTVSSSSSYTSSAVIVRLLRVDTSPGCQSMRLKTLNGAPFPQNLDFSERSLLALNECNGFSAGETIAETNDEASTLKWRSLGTKDARLRTGWSQPYLPQSGMRLDQTDVSIALPHVQDASTLLEADTTWQETTMSFDAPATAADDFLQHSLIFHDTLLSSQVAQDMVTDQTISSSSFLTTSFGTTTSELSSPSRADGQTLILQVPSKMTIAPLGSLPSAQHLHSIYPQTPTPNTICVLMAPIERREVLVRRGGFKMDLYELTVGDDTRAGFKVTFWLRPPRQLINDQSHVQRSLLETLDSIKTGDILLLRNIALTSFRDTVYGQSLNPAIARARTTIDVLMKGTGLSVGQVDGLSPTVVETFMRVKKWARGHVATNEGGSRTRTGVSARRDGPETRVIASSMPDEYLPPDTMEAV